MEEGQLAYLGAVAAAPGPGGDAASNDTIVVADVGGMSTEVVWADGGDGSSGNVGVGAARDHGGTSAAPLLVASVPLGCVTLTDALGTGGLSLEASHDATEAPRVPTSLHGTSRQHAAPCEANAPEQASPSSPRCIAHDEARLAAAVDRTHAALARLLPPLPPRTARLVLSSGTATTLAALALWLREYERDAVNACELTRDDVRALAIRAMPPAQHRQERGRHAQSQGGHAQEQQQQQEPRDKQVKSQGEHDQQEQRHGVGFGCEAAALRAEFDWLSEPRARTLAGGAVMLLALMKWVCMPSARTSDADGLDGAAVQLMRDVRAGRI